MESGGGRVLGKWASENLNIFITFITMIVAVIVFAFTNFETKEEAHAQNQNTSTAFENVRQDLRDINNKLDALLERSK